MEFTMITRTLVLSPEALAFLEREALRGLIEGARDLAELDEKKEPASYGGAFARVRAGVLALADIWNGDDARPLHEEYSMDHPPPAAFGVDRILPHSFEEQRAMVNGGLDPIKELGPHDPRASRPRCTHGKYFTEDCDKCAEPLAMEAAARCNCEYIGGTHEPMCATNMAPS